MWLTGNDVADSFVCIVSVLGSALGVYSGSWGFWDFLVQNGDLCSSPNIVRVIKSRRMRWVGHVARMGSAEVCTGFWWGNLRERDHWRDTGVNGG